ncbi:DNA mismatch endonuclease Vsr [Pseudohalocynthiibacter aestuariivivens]|nr:very short patch repair endonuclease [Pseudohalocynthiibacter aestuariivivens]MBS9718525.1 DNA mismatch endonuclease Vsr [Pseudohalocynthiibacter aestuariivivens]
MADVHDTATRSRNMAAIKGKDTRPELILRSGLHARGFRFRLHHKKLPGKPDLVFPKYRAVLFANGCFWHGHECHLFKWPKSREEFWRTKIGGNVERDQRNAADLQSAGWRIGVVWECALKGKWRRDTGDVIDTVATWLSSDANNLCVESRLVD